VNEVEVRDAQSDDAATIAEIWFVGWRDGHLGNVTDELVRSRTAESFLTRATERVADTRVATVDGEIAGFTMVADDEVEQVYVTGLARGHGVAVVLLADAERRIDDSGHATAWLAVVAGNARARRFYERSGWSDRGGFDYEAKSESGPILVPSRRYEKNLHD
jgi:GNAT superfamily N-acetyltransferase